MKAWASIIPPCYYVHLLSANTCVTFEIYVTFKPCILRPMAFYPSIDLCEHVCKTCVVYILCSPQCDNFSNPLP